MPATCWRGAATRSTARSPGCSTARRPDTSSWSRCPPTCWPAPPVRNLRCMAPISFAHGDPSLDIDDVDGLREAAARAFANDTGGATAYGTAIGYKPLRKWIAEYHDVGE